MSTIDGHEPASGSRVIDDAVCTACPCLCDDIALMIEGDRILEARNACPRGTDYFSIQRAEESPACLVDGQASTMDAAIARAANILAAASHPLIFGLGQTTSEAQRAAVALAARIGACIDASSGQDDHSTTGALQSDGQVTATLGEIRNRGDLILVWRTDPLESHPRLFSRYALDPTGYFVPGGRSDRFCVVIDVNQTRSAREVANQFLSIKEDGEIEALWTLRALARGVELDPVAVESGTEVPLETWRGLVGRMTAARYGVIFYGTGGANGRRGSLIARGIHSLTRELNATTRFVCLPLASCDGRDTGARNVLTWTTGYPGAVSLSRGDPRYGPGEFGPGEILRKGEADAALIVADSPRSSEMATGIPRIVLTSDGSEPCAGPAVVFRTSVLGLHTTGTVYRMDGVPLPLRPVLTSPFPSAEEVLRAIERCVRSLTAPVPGPQGERQRCL
jgi:formylmethanofuran dehydrogenase subunit B